MIWIKASRAAPAYARGHHPFADIKDFS